MIKGFTRLTCLLFDHQTRPLPREVFDRIRSETEWAQWTVRECLRCGEFVIHRLSDKDCTETVQTGRGLNG
jgi:hypothetical protein